MNAVEPALEEYTVTVNGETKIAVKIDGKQHTVELREPKTFESQLINDLIDRGGHGNVIKGAAEPIKGKWIYGWLEQKGQDYINNIFRNYLFFIRYLQGKTSEIQNIQTYKRAPGTYDSMYRYILLLEEANLVDRFKTVEVSNDEYDHFVPDMMQRRTYVKITTDYDDAPEKWENAYEAVYPEHYEGEVLEEELDEEEQFGERVERSIEEEEVTEESEDIKEEPVEADREIEPVSEVEQPERRELEINKQPEDKIEEEKEVEVPKQEVSITSFPKLDKLEQAVKRAYNDALEQTIEENEGQIEFLEPQDFDLEIVAIIGEWAGDEAVPGEVPLQLVVSINGSGAPRKPGIILQGVSNNMQQILNGDNPYEEWFPTYQVEALYDSVFDEQIVERIQEEQQQRYYNLLTQNWVQPE